MCFSSKTQKLRLKFCSNMSRVKAEENRPTYQEQANHFPTVINNEDIIKEMTDWNAQETDRQVVLV